MFDSFLSYINLPVTLFGIIAIEALGLQLILGGAGLLSLGHAAFFAIGGYASAAFVTFLAPLLSIQNPYLLLVFGLLFAILTSSLSSFFLSIPCLKLRGDYLAVVTLGFSQILQNIFYNIPSFGGASGFTNIPKLANMGVIFFLLILTAFFLKRFYQTGLGQSILCVREDDVVAMCFGISPAKCKLIAFALGNGITGMAGCLYVHTLQFISPQAAGFQKSVEVLLAVVVGGMYSITGSILGAGLLVLLPEGLRFLPQFTDPFVHQLVKVGWISPVVSSLFDSCLKNDMLLFSMIVLLILRKNRKQ